jgi:5-methyltetrahydrofolate--homocysteine methyltransferase
MPALFEQISEALIDGMKDKVLKLVQQALDEGSAPKDIINNALLSGMSEVGVLFKDGELFVPEVLVAARAMNAGIDLLKPLLAEGDIDKKGKIIFCTVRGDLHDIGKKLVSMMLEGAGYEVIDLGVDVSPEAILEAVKKHNPDIIGMSALLTTTMTAMKETVDALIENGLASKVKVMVGGAPVSDRFAKEIGAQYAGDAATAVEVANSLIAMGK